jgi:ferredoxin
MTRHRRMRRLETLEYVAENVTAESRLACQIMATEFMDGAVLWVAT